MPETTRLSIGAVEPLKTGPLHPRWGLGTLPATQSKTAPTPTRETPDNESLARAIHSSCFGIPMPTHTTSGAASTAGAVHIRTKYGWHIAMRPLYPRLAEQGNEGQSWA